MKRVFYTALCSILLNLGFSAQAWAHERHYVFTEEYKTLPQGGMEIEGHTRFKVPNRHRTDRNEITYMGELEYGLTDHLTVTHYEIWKTVNRANRDDNTTYNGFQFETKYRIGEKGKYWVDPLLYLEWKTNPRNQDNPNTLEGKIVLSKDWDKFNLSYNQVMDSVLGDGGRTTHQFVIGTSYNLIDELYVGLEMKGDYWRPSSQLNRFALGPSLAYATKYFWVTWGLLFGANAHADDFETRLIIGVPIF